MKIKLEIGEGVSIPANIESICETTDEGTFIETDDIKTTQDVLNQKGATENERALRKTKELELKKFKGIDPTKVTELEDELAELKAGKIDPEDIKKSKEDLKLYYEGKFSKKEQEYFTQIQDLKNTISDKEKAIRDGVLEKLIEENTRATAEPASMEFVILGLKKLFKYDEEEEKFVSNDGVTPVKEVCEKFLEKNPFLSNHQVVQTLKIVSIQKSLLKHGQK